MNRRLTYLFCLLLFLTSELFGLPSTSLASDLSIRGEVERNRFTIADPVRFTLTITAEKGVEFFTPDEKIPLYPFEVIGYRILEDGEGLKRIEYLITIYDVGEFEIPSLILPYKYRTAEIKEASTQPIKVVVEGIAPLEAEELKEIRGPIEPDELSPDSREGYPWVVLGLVTGILSGIIISLVLRHRKKGNLNDTGTLDSPLEEAIKELEAIRTMGLLEKGEIKKYHVLIADIIKRYIANRFSLHVRVMTTQELMKEIKEMARSDGKMDLLSELLADCDLVKFSPYKPLLRDAKEVIARAREIIVGLSSIDNQMQAVDN